MQHHPSSRTTHHRGPPIIRPYCVSSEMKHLAAAEITKITTNSPAKHCSLDPVLTWLVKRALPLLADTNALMLNTSIIEDIFPDVLKHAIVCQRLKKPLTRLDSTQFLPSDIESEFVSKTVKQVVAACFSEQVEEHHLLQSQSSQHYLNSRRFTGSIWLQIQVSSYFVAWSSSLHSWSKDHRLALPEWLTITYKLCVFMNLVHIGCSPAYLTELVNATHKLPSRFGLRLASSQQYEVPWTTLKFVENERCHSQVQLPVERSYSWCEGPIGHTYLQKTT